MFTFKRAGKLVNRAVGMIGRKYYSRGTARVLERKKFPAGSEFSMRKGSDYLFK